MEVQGTKSLLFQDVREDLRHAIAKDTVTIKNEGLAVEDRSVAEPGCQDALDFQKKITPRTRSKIAEMEDDDQLFNLALEARLDAVETIKQSQQELIVVASLVDRIPNLAGLTRTCEVPCHMPLCGCLLWAGSLVFCSCAGLQSIWLGCCRQEHSSGQAVPADQVCRPTTTTIIISLLHLTYCSTIH